MTDPDLVVDCRYCGEEIPVDASRCPHCDARVTTKPWAYALGGFGAIVALIFAVGGLTPLFVMRNWQAGVGAGAVMLLFAVRLYKIRSGILADAHPPGEAEN